jgi:hypothetical protein
MDYVRKAYGVPCRRGVSIRAWRSLQHPGGIVWTPASSITPITSASHHVFAGVAYHPCWHLEYIDKEGYRLWPITEKEFGKAELPMSLAEKMNPVRVP